MNNQVDRIVRRTQRYWYEDGFVEIGIGVLFALIGVLLYVQVTWLTGLASAVALALVLPTVIIGGALLTKRIVQGLKSQVTFPRTGYVAYDEKRRDTGRGRWLIMGFALALAVGTLIADALIENYSLNHIALAEGLLLAAVLGYLGWRFRLARFMLSAAVAAALGIIIPIAGVPETAGTAAVFGGVGLVLMATGLLALLVYLRHNPPPEEM